MLTKITVALAIVAATATGSLAATKRQHSVNPAWDVYDTRGNYVGSDQIRLSVAPSREIAARIEVEPSAAVSLRIGRLQWSRSSLVIIWRDQVANGWRRAGNKQSDYTLLVAPVSLRDAFMLAQMF
jgi:hypothetical protein